MPQAIWIALSIGAVISGIILVGRPFYVAVREARFAKVRRNFHTQRERLEAKFVRIASGRAKSGYPRWEDCDFDDGVAYVRIRKTGELWAFVAITVEVDPSDLSGAHGGLIGNLRAGTAVFRFDRDHWETDGKAFLTLSPAEAVRFYRSDLEMVEQELARRVS
jgi:hypothetical protein